MESFVLAQHGRVNFQAEKRATVPADLDELLTKTPLSGTGSATH